MDKKTALEVYTSLKQESSIWLGAYLGHSQQYFTLVIAISGASIAAVTQFDALHPALIRLMILLGPALNIVLCWTGIEMCDRSYQVYLEGLSIQAKLEPILGLTEKRNALVAQQLLPEFPKDEHFLPERWLENRGKYGTAKDFITKSMQLGANRIIRQTFITLAGANVAIAVCIGWLICSTH